MIPAAVVFLYLALALYVGVVRAHQTRGDAEDYFLEGRSLKGGDKAAESS